MYQIKISLPEEVMNLLIKESVKLGCSTDDVVMMWYVLSHAFARYYNGKQ